MMTDKMQQKIVNALVPEAPLALWVKILLFWAVYPSIRASSGLWVGGTVTLGDSRLVFEPNLMNRLFLSKDVSFAVGLDQVRSVRVEPARFTRIIVLNTDQGERRVRCYDAEGFAATIDGARSKAA